MIFNGSYVFSTIYCQFFMLFNGNFIFFVNFPCYPIAILHFFFNFLLIFHVIQWKMCIFLLFVNFLCYSMGSLQVVIFPCYSMGSLHFVIFPCYSMEIWELRRVRGGRMDGRTDVRKFTPVSNRTSALWGRCPKRVNRNVWPGKDGLESCLASARVSISLA